MKTFKGLAILITAYIFTATALAQITRPTVYLEPQNGFEDYLAAAIEKKNVPIDIVTDRTKATYVLKSAPVEIKQESTGGKIARCLFAYCIGIEDKGNVSVQLVEVSSSKVLWAYSVNKQKGGSKNEQSMAEATAKHFKEFLAHNQLRVHLKRNGKPGTLRICPTCKTTYWNTPRKEG